LRQCSHEVELIGPIDTNALIVTRRGETELDGAFATKAFERQEETPIEFGAVSCERVDLVRGVESFAKALSSSPRRIAANDDDVAIPTRPLALNTPEPRSEIEDQITAATLGNRLVDVNP
jgi:hypothetical protein